VPAAGATTPTAERALRAPAFGTMRCMSVRAVRMALLLAIALRLARIGAFRARL